MGRPLPRLPWAELEEHLGVYTIQEVALVTGRQRETISRWKRHGIPVCDADEVATAFGFHPVEIWADWDSVELPQERGTRPCEQCGELFRQKRPEQRFHSHDCYLASRRAREPRAAYSKDRLCESCGTAYRAAAPHQKYCGPRCARREAMRRQRQRPEVQAKNRARRMRYYWQYREYENAQEKKRRQNPAYRAARNARERARRAAGRESAA